MSFVTNGPSYITDTTGILERFVLQVDGRDILQVDDFVEIVHVQSAWEHHGGLIRCICTIGDAVHRIEYLKEIQDDGMEHRMGDIRACLEGHKEYTSELDLSLSKAVGESDAGKKIVFDADAVMEDASRAQHLAMEHLDGLDRDLCELKRVYSRLRPGGSKDLVNEEENGRLVFVASALDILQEDFSILGPVARASSAVTLPEEMEAYVKVARILDRDT